MIVEGISHKEAVMKKLLPVMVLLLLCMAVPAFAMYCNKCGK
ncbi:MAG: hypothetical protein GQF41_1941 [Candidatus Rifleibacterium amylolyticum]|nr:MAG: hypothetical protein GQF41_1941 [Candidatus Rifleibacterium amylolyticum]